MSKQNTILIFIPTYYASRTITSLLDRIAGNVKREVKEILEKLSDDLPDVPYAIFFNINLIRR